MLIVQRLEYVKLKRQTPGERVDSILAAVPPATVIDPSTLPIASPWSSSNLTRVVAEDIFGTGIPINTRSAAMRIPAVARARNLMVSTICRLPMVAMRGADRLPIESTPTWLYRTNQATSPQLRLAWTVDDLIFYGWSCWFRVNDADGFPLAYTRVNQGDWAVNADNRVEIHGQPQPDNAVTLIGGLHEGLLSYGVDALQDARALYSIVRTRLQNPVPQIDLHQVDGEPLTEPEIDALIDRWAAARRGANGGVSYSNKSIEPKEMGAGGDGQLLIEARNAASLDMARLVGIAAGRIDATSPKSSLNYETTTGRNQEFVDFDLALYMTPIAARLSLDDVMPRGQHVAFDLADFTEAAPSVTGPALED